MGSYSFLTKAITSFQKFDKNSDIHSFYMPTKPDLPVISQFWEKVENVGANEPFPLWTDILMFFSAKRNTDILKTCKAFFKK